LAYFDMAFTEKRNAGTETLAGIKAINTDDE
jgi:hypothetical protein